MNTPRLKSIDRWITTISTLGAVAATAHTLVNLRQLRTPSPTPTPVSQRVSVLVPARNEAVAIGRCLDAVRAQQSVANLEIVVLDDQSTDGTEQVVRHHLADKRVRLVSSRNDPPTGWLGKTWACYQLSEQAKGQILVFVDADVVLSPNAIAAAADLLTDFDAVCPYPRQLTNSWSERLVQPLLQWSWLTFLPLGLAERSSRPSLSAANGQFLVISRSAYDEIGGHASVRADVIEDVALFRQLKRAGHRGVIADGTSLATCHMYDNWAQLSAGYEKSLWSAFGSRPAAIAVSTLLGVIYVVPALAMLRGSKTGTVGYLAGVVGRVAVARRVEGRVWPDSAAHPLSILTLGYLTARSLHSERRGSLKWKDRSLAKHHPSATT